MNPVTRKRLLPYMVAGLALVVIVWAAAYRSISMEREREFENSAKQAKSLAAFFERQTSQTLTYGDSYLKLARREFLENGGVEISFAALHRVAAP